jgi:hypothetical protein
MQKILFHARSFLLLDFADQSRFFKAKWTVLRSRLKVWRGDLQSGSAPGAEFQSDAAGSEEAILAKIWALNDIAIVKYQPKPYDGVITDFQPMDNYSRFKDPAASWGKVAKNGGHEVITLPVLPATMLVDYVRVYGLKVK